MSKIPLEIFNISVNSNKTIELKKSDYCTSSTSFSTQSCGKVYMVCATKLDGTVHYVGQTKRSIVERFKSNIYSTHPYPWTYFNKGQTTPLKYDLLVWDLSEHCSDNPSILENVEAELVFGVRIYQRAWPKDQTDISFSHIVDERSCYFAPHLARKMMEQFHDYLIAKCENDNDAVMLFTKSKNIVTDNLTRLLFN